MSSYSKIIKKRRITDMNEGIFRNLMEYIPESIQGYTTSGIVFYWNKASERIYGYTAEEAIGKNLEDLIIPADLKPLFKVCLESGKKVKKSGEFMPAGELKLLHKEGHLVPVYSIHSAVYIDGKEPLLFCIDVDLSEQKRTEERLKQIKDELERSNLELRQFAYGVAHDLLNPLNIIAGCIHLFEQRYKGNLDSNFDDLLGYAVNEFKRIKSFVEDLLAYAQIEMMNKDFKPADISSALEKAVFNLQHAIEESDAVVTNDTLPVIMADEIQMVRLLQNFISNAIKYRTEKPPEVHISAERGIDEWIISIRDNGIGIDTGYSEQIFIMFQRLNRRTIHPGSGLGLTICRKIVEQHGGRIWVKSEPGKGSIFYFAIPDRHQ